MKGPGTEVLLARGLVLYLRDNSPYTRVSQFIFALACPLSAVMGAWGSVVALVLCVLLMVLTEARTLERHAGRPPVLVDQSSQTKRS